MLETMMQNPMNYVSTSHEESPVEPQKVVMKPEKV
jgi:hypothetical protein